MTDWKFVIATADEGEPLAELRNASSRRLTFPRQGAQTAAFTIDGDDPAGLVIEELRTDLLAFRDDVPMLRARIGGTVDSFDGTTHKVSVTATDYRGLLEQRRRVQSALTYTGDTKWEIVSALLAHTQGQIGGDLGLVMGDDIGGATHDRAYEVDKEIGAAITELGTSATEAHRFDWWTDPDMVLQMASPTRGTFRDFSAVYGETIGSGSRTVDPTQYANHVAGIGDPEATTRYTSQAADLASRVEGRFEAVWADPDLTVQATVNARTDAERVSRELILPSYAFKLTKGAEWSPEDLWTGDTCRLVIRAGRLDLNIVERVETVDISIDDNGAESVSVTWGTDRRDNQARRLRLLGQRLDNLERR